MWNKPKVILLASNQEVNSLYGYKDKSLLFNYNKDGYNKLEAEKEFTQHFHLYIINDDVIKEDWVVWENCAVMKCFKAETNSLWLRKEDGNSKLVDRIQCKKVVVTTDNELGFGDGTGYFEHLPQIPQSFIEQYITEYNQGKIISDVLVEYDCDHNQMPNKVIDIVKINQDNSINIKTVKDSFSRDEVETLLFNLAEYYGMTSTKSEIDDFNTWIKQNL